MMVVLVCHFKDCDCPVCESEFDLNWLRHRELNGHEGNDQHVLFWLSHDKCQWQYIHVLMRPHVLSAFVPAEVSWGQARVFPCLSWNVRWSVRLHIQKKIFNYSVFPQWHSMSHEHTLTHIWVDSHSYYDDKTCRRHSVSESPTPLRSSRDGPDSMLLRWYDIMYSWKLSLQIDPLFHWKLWSHYFFFLKCHMYLVLGRPSVNS